MLNKNKIKFILFAIILFVVVFLVITFFGGTYTYKVDVGSNNIDDLNINIEEDKDVLRIIDKNFDDGVLVLKLKSLNKGRAFIEISSDDFSTMELFYVHSFGIITQNSYFGKSNADILMPLFTLIYVISLIIFLVKKYHNNLNYSIYQYKNITYLGVIIFLVSLSINSFFQIFNYNGLISSIKNVLDSVRFFSTIVFPIAVLISIFVIISNIVLLKKESFTWKNMLGIILGLFIIFSTLFPEIVSNYLHSLMFVDFYNEKGILLYIYNFLETFIFALLTYLECILLGTIILGVIASKNMPKYDKDYIIILGCKVKDDGTLTPLLKERVDRALEFARLQKEIANKDIIFVPSGGKGSDEIISEALAMKKYLIECGVDSSKIIVENKSKSTYENIKFSYNKINNKNAKISFATTNYHVFRVGNIAFNQNIMLEGIGSKTKSYFFINAFIREFVATIYAEKRRHLKILLIIMIICIALILLMYLSNIL